METDLFFSFTLTTELQFRLQRSQLDGESILSVCSGQLIRNIAIFQFPETQVVYGNSIKKLFLTRTV